MYGLQFEWVENDPVYVKEFMYLRLKGSLRPAIFASISRQYRSGIINRKYYWVLRINLKDARTGRDVGGFYDSRDDAVAACKQYMKGIFRDPRDDGPQPKES